MSTASYCVHFGECGGCASQDVPYEEQVDAKAQYLQGLLAAAWATPIPVIPSPVQWHYRNKVDPAFSRMQYPEPPPAGFVRETVLGFKKKGRWFWPLDISECRIAPERLGELLASVRAWCREHELRAYDSRSGDGFLRHLLVRRAARTGERMVVLITSPGVALPAGFVEAVKAVFPAHSIQHGTFGGRADVAIAETLEVLDGAPHIMEELHLSAAAGGRNLRFRISPMSFFQTNTSATELLYAAIRDWAQRVRPARLYDLYGGAGGIAFTSADLAETVVSVENVAAASEDGIVNAGLNQIHNVTFVTEKVEHYLRAVRDSGGMPTGSAVVVDPPRAGLHPKVLKRLLEMRPDRLLYVSCNPKLFAREFEVLQEGYQLESLRGFDLFPHTPHVELLAELRARS